MSTTPSVAAYRRLQRDYADATEQFNATNEVLRALGRSTSEPDDVLHTIVESARRLCRCQAAQVYLLDDGLFALASAVGLSDEFVRQVTEFPFTVDRGTSVGRAAMDRSIQRVDDVLADPEYARLDVQKLAASRSLISAPMLLDEEVVGALSLVRTTVSPFDDREAALLAAFAAQAAVVVRNVHLVSALEERGSELTRRVQQLEALSEVSEIVGSSLVLDEVLANIVMNAVRFAGCDGGSIMEYVEESHSFSVRGAYATSPELLAQLRDIRIERATTLVGRVTMQGHPSAVSDLALVERDPHLQLLYDHGWRSVVAVPVLHDGQTLGALVVRGRAPAVFSAETLEFLEAFATQSAVAVSNAQLFRELEQKSAELQVVSQHKSDFLASMSHELRTPLNAVIGFSEVLLERLFGDLNEQQDEYLRDILSSGRHLLALLNDILDLSKVEAGRMEIDVSTFSVSEAVEYAIALVRERAAQHGITVSRRDELTVDHIESDELRFRQVLLNLLSNAVKFTPDGGLVEVSTRRRDGELAITVRDTGSGVPPEDRDRIFESFQQGRRGPSREEGTGLGLTLCRRIVTALGGRMWLDTEVGVGSTFGFSVPAQASHDTSTREDSPTTEPSRTVVIIDDDRSSLDLLSAYLVGTGLHVVRAKDGQDGLDAVERLNPAVIVLDIRLPGMDGWAVLHAIRNGPSRAIPVVIVSILDERPRGLAQGAADYLTKPVSREDLLNALKRLRILGDPVPDAPVGVE